MLKDTLLESLVDISKLSVKEQIEILERLQKDISNQLSTLYGHNGG